MKPRTIDEYIAAGAEEVRPALRRVRSTIREVAPGAEETILYDIPTFTLMGKRLVHFAAWKQHISVYPVPGGDEAFRREIEPYRAGKGTLRFPIASPIPFDLIARVVLHLIAERHAR